MSEAERQKVNGGLGILDSGGYGGLGGEGGVGGQTQKKVLSCYFRGFAADNIMCNVNANFVVTLVPQFRADNKNVTFEILEFLGFRGDNKFSTSLHPWGPQKGPDGVSMGCWKGEVGGGGRGVGWET